MYSFNEFVLEKKNNLKWFLKKLNATPLNVDILGLSEDELYLNINEIIKLKSVVKFLRKNKVRLGEVFDPYTSQMNLKNISFVFLTPWEEDQTANPVYVIYQKENGPINIAEIHRDDYDLFKELNPINEAMMTNFIEDIKKHYENWNKSDENKDTYRRKLIFSLKDFIFYKNNNFLKLKGKELDYDHIKFLRNGEIIKKISWGVMDDKLLKDITEKILKLFSV